MEIVQKKGSNTHTFTFHDEYLNFGYDNKSGSGDFDINYADCPKKSSVRIEQNEWLRNVGLIWLALGVFQFGFAAYSGNPLLGNTFWFLAGVACIAWSQYSKVKYTVFTSENGNIFVIQGKQHDQVVEQLQARKKSQLLNWYGEVNPENDLENEIQKFRWLAEQNVITAEESEQKIAEAEFLKNDDSGFPEDQLN